MFTSNNSHKSNQQTLADSGANERPPMLENRNYIPWESRFKRFLDNKLEDGERMWNSIQNGPYQRPMIADPNNLADKMLEPLSKMTKGNKKQYTADVRVMNYLLQAIPNDIYNSMDASKEGELLDSVYERLTTLVNIMDRNNVRPIPVSINTKFLNCLQPEWRKYVTMVRHNQTGYAISYDELYDSLMQFEPHVLASRAKKSAKNHYPLALIAHSNASSSHSHANSSYYPQSYYVTHPPSVADYDDKYQGELQGDSQEDKLTTAMMLLARAISQKFSLPTNNRYFIQYKESSCGSGWSSKANVQCYNCNEKGHYTRECQKPKVRDAKYFREQILLARKDEAGNNLSNKENDFMLDNACGEETLDELTASVNVSSKANGQVSHVKSKTIIHTSDDDQIDSSIIFDDPHVENNDGTSKHDSNAYDEYHEIQMLAYNVQHSSAHQVSQASNSPEKNMLKSVNIKLLAKKAFKDRENRYLEDIVDLEEKLISHDRIVYKMGQSIQTIHMIGKKPNKVYDPFLKAGLDYQNPECLKKAIVAQPKMYDGDSLHSDKLIIDSI
nr:hypothetical protein [Tanacetum cinerariifolium]